MSTAWCTTSHSSRHCTSAPSRAGQHCARTWMALAGSEHFLAMLEKVETEYRPALDKLADL